jgi:hypothetical protein
MYSDIGAYLTVVPNTVFSLLIVTSPGFMHIERRNLFLPEDDGLLGYCAV